MARLTGRVALVTGAAAGIGAACVRALAAEGAVVIAADRDAATGADLLHALAAEGVGGVEFALLDVRDAAGWTALVEGITARHGRLDILVNNAGIQRSQNLEEITLADWRDVFQVNMEGTFLGSQAAIGAMKARGGAIINMCSTFSRVADALNAHYCASKAAVAQFTKATALHCAAQGYRIRVNSVHPGVIRTPMLDREIRDVARERGEATTAAVETEWARLTPLGIGSPSDIAAGVIYLASDDARYVTGLELAIDGGHLIQ